MTAPRPRSRRCVRDEVSCGVGTTPRRIGQWPAVDIPEPALLWFVLARMRSFAAIAILVLGMSLAAQESNGAQDQTATSGHYRVRAESLTGIGPKSNGPYHFRFTCEEAGLGTYHQLGTFERTWNTRASFRMSLVMSPSGNGFLLGTSMDHKVLLLGCDGRVLADLQPARATARVSLWVRDPQTFWLRGLEGFDARRAEVFVPFGEVLTEGHTDPGAKVAAEAAAPRWWPIAADERAFRTRMLTWTPSIGERDRDAALDAIARLCSQNDAAHPTAMRALSKMGWSAVEPLETAIAAATTRAEARARLVAVRQELDRLACGHRDPWRNLDLLWRLGKHVDVAYREASALQLARILPEGVEPKAEWFADHRLTLRWDKEAVRYIEIKLR